MEKYNETQLLRMTKDELIDHIFHVYKINELQFHDLVEWYDVSEKIQELRGKQGLSED